VYERKDAFYHKAKREGYRSRAAYKLLELNQTFHLIKPGDQVVDLGSWPGGWVQVAAALVGQSGRVVGLDLITIDPLPLDNVMVLQGDATDRGQQEQVRSLLGGPADVLLSDVAPKLSGIREADEARAMELCRAVLLCVPALLRPGGTLLLKVFMTPEYKALLTELKTRFATVKTTRPESTRKGSAETYVIAKGLKQPV
jgi:23S rRNA (uridine2552-2'-O)-methyltransferase